jgi:uncharacterized membrane protein
MVIYGLLAQLVEHRTFNPQVLGSSPRRSIKKKKVNLMKKDYKKLIVMIPAIIVGLGLLEFNKTQMFPIDTLAFTIAITVLAGAIYLSDKYKKYQKWIEENPQHFDSKVWLGIPAIGSLMITLECYTSGTERPLSAIIMYFLVLAFWENIISAVDKWLPPVVELPIKITLLPLLIPIATLQAVGVLEKKYYAPYF